MIAPTKRFFSSKERGASSSTQEREGDSEDDYHNHKEGKGKDNGNSSGITPPVKLFQPRPWEDNYKYLVDFYIEHGHCNVQAHHTKTYPSLHYFVTKQRHNRDKLTDAQIQKLNNLGFQWETQRERHERLWRERYNELVEIKERNGHCDIPTRFEPNPSLGQWVVRQRKLYKNGDLPRERHDLLHKIGFCFQMPEPPLRDNKFHDSKWEKQFLKLIDHVRYHGDFVVAIRNDPSLSDWATRQRALERKGLLRPDRKDQLKEICFAFDIDNTNPTESLLQLQWDKMFEQLLQYKEKEGHVNVPQKYKGHLGLGRWVAQQRKRQKEGKLEGVRHERLLELGFQFTTTREEKWEQSYELLKAYYETHGHTFCKRQEDNALASWVFTQRSMYRDGRLSKDRQTRLEALNFVWKSRNRSGGNDAEESD